MRDEKGKVFSIGSYLHIDEIVDCFLDNFDH